MKHIENTKFVFQHKIASLQEEIKPKESKIHNLHQQILDMEVELTHNVKQLSDNSTHTEEVKAKLANTLTDLTLEKRKVNLAQANMVKIIKELELLQSRLQDSKKLKEVALNLCNKVDSK